MLSGIFTWLGRLILSWLADWAKAEVSKKQSQMQKEKEQGETNEKNIKAYEQAVTREEEIAAALDLLNRNRR